METGAKNGRFVDLILKTGVQGEPMIAEILSTGEEIRRGTIIDSNTAHIAEKLETLGVHVARHLSVGDDMEELVSLFTETGNRADVAIVTGGLGPTQDDLTAEAAAKAADDELVLDAPAFEAIKRFFQERQRPMASSNKKQAMLPSRAECLYNPMGTAPGFRLKIGKCEFFFVPGVPAEMRNMMEEAVLPRIIRLRKDDNLVFLNKTLTLFGLTESETGERLSLLEKEYPDIQVGIRFRFPIIRATLYIKGPYESELNSRLSSASDFVLNILANRVISVDGLSMEAEVGRLLQEKNATLSIAESCTGGLISHLLTNVPGSSNYFVFSGITYSNDAKINVLGVAPDIIDQYGAVHEETAKKMAEGAKRVSGASYGLSTSGIAGPDGGAPDKPVGTVCIGLATPGGSFGKRYQFHYPERIRNKKMFTMTALNLLRRELLNAN